MLDSQNSINEYNFLCRKIGNELCSVAGWGMCSHHNHSHPFGNCRLKKINVPIVNYMTCRRKLLPRVLNFTKKIVTNNHICAGPPETCHVLLFFMKIENLYLLSLAIFSKTFFRETLVAPWFVICPIAIRKRL